MRLQYKNTVFVIAAFVIVSASFFVGFYSGIAYNMTDERSLPINTTDGMPESVDFSMFWKVWHMVEDNYVSIDTVDEQQMVWGAISGLVSSLGDPYSVFFPPKENKYFESEIRGNFEGVGMEIGIRDDVLTIIAPLKGTPAGRAGLLASDKIIKIDETSSAGLSVDEAVDLIRGEKGSTVTFVIFREGKSE
ncbi:MAG: peptidase S41, partial [Candidatus Yonathbacteria bacterium CG_4_10_14_3_um_filter_47_65]